MIHVRGSSRVLALVGDPVAHSLSPTMHNAAIAVLGVDAVYVALRVPADALSTAFEAFRATGVAGNVTVPHKVAALAAVSEATPAARAVGAVNTFWCDGDALVGDNTDVIGVIEALEALGAGGPLLLTGTGGAARAVAVAAAGRDTEVLVRSRDPDRAAAFATWARAHGGAARVDDASPIGTVVNATPTGLHPGDPMPVPDARLGDASAALDLVYAPGETAWIRACRARGMRAGDGRLTLVGQGIAAFERFFPGRRAPREVMRAAVEGALT